MWKGLSKHEMHDPYLCPLLTIGQIYVDWGYTDCLASEKNQTVHSISYEQWPQDQD